MKEYGLNDIVQMKKGHPCGNNLWKIIRMGADIKIKCTECGRIVMIPKLKFDKGLKKIVEKASEE